MSFTREQPKIGDTILHCGHLGLDKDAEPPAHWFKYEKSVKFEHPDGTCGDAEWFAICTSCHVKYKRGDNVAVRADRLWIANEKMNN